MSILDRVKNIKNRRISRTLQVKSVNDITPNMRRITLHGEALLGFPPDSEGAYIKLLFDQQGQSKPSMRTYTVAEQRAAIHEIDVDFMLHNEHNNTAVQGLAAIWANNAVVGSEISILGPGPATFINTNAEYLFFAGDMTALPAIKANLKRLSKHAKGIAFIEVTTKADIQALEKPDNIEVQWIINDKPDTQYSSLFHAIEKARLPAENIAVWVACEFKTMREIRRYLKKVCKLEKSHTYISSYWKKGNTEDQHKQAKQDDAKQVVS